MPPRGERVQQVMGNLFQLAPSDHALAHCVGADLRMGKGIAVDFREKYGNKEYLLQQGKSPGQVAVLPKEMCGRSAPIFYLVSKLRSSDYGPRWEDFCSCLEQLRNLCVEMGVRHVSMPRIGCFNDHLSWPRVERQLYITFQKSPVSVFVFHLIHPLDYNFIPALHHLQPAYRGYQLIGDSNLVRFASKFCSNIVGERFPRQLGLCVSGQRAKSLIFHLHTSEVLPKVAVMIGTNDALHINRHEALKKDIKQTLRATFSQLAKYLSLRCRDVLFLTIPPIPAHAKCDAHVSYINTTISSVCSGYGNISVVDLCSKLKGVDGKVNVSLFESTMGPPGWQREDLIHLNHQGHLVLKGCLDGAL